MWQCQVLLVVLFAAVTSQQQRTAPGVPPQQYQGSQPQYQQPQHQQQFQQVPVQQQQYQQQQQQQQFQQVPQQQQFQQVPQQQFQQVPQQQFQQVPQQQFAQQPVHDVPVHHQQVPIQHHEPHNHHANIAPGQILNAENIVREKEHLGEHLGAAIDTSKMTEQELQFHYFKLHDADNNNKLDGCELIKSLIHWHESGHKDPMNPNAAPQEKLFGDEELVNLIDPIFAVDDTNNDGFIDYPEFVHAQNKAAAKPAP